MINEINDVIISSLLLLKIINALAQEAITWSLHMCCTVSQPIPVKNYF